MLQDTMRTSPLNDTVLEVVLARYSFHRRAARPGTAPPRTNLNVRCVGELLGLDLFNANPGSPERLPEDIERSGDIGLVRRASREHVSCVIHRHTLPRAPARMVEEMVG